MGNIRQKKKNRSSVPRAKLNKNRTKAGKKKINIGNDIVASNWDRSLTLVQNYRRLGLSSRLRAATGGTEQKRKTTQDGSNADKDPLAIPSQSKSAKLLPTEARVERDPSTGRILRVVRPKSEEDPAQKRRRLNPLSDPLNELSDVGNDEEGDDITSHEHEQPRSVVVQALEAQAAEEEAQLARTKRPRQQSQREQEWIERLVARHGDDITAMVRDRKLNPMQQSEGDISKRVRVWKDRQHRDVGWG